MFTIQTKKKSPCGLCKKKTVNDVGLGDAIQQEWGGQSTTGGMVSQVASFMAPPIQMIPGFSQLQKIAEKTGFRTDPLNLALATNPVTGWMQLIPGFNKMIGGLFKKATHMESCMKWWTDENITGMIKGRMPYAIDVAQSFPEASREYQINRARHVTDDEQVVRLLDVPRRQKIMIAAFVSSVRAYPDLMQAQCAAMPQGRAETGVTFTESDLAPVWNGMKEAAQVSEYKRTLKAIENILAPYAALVKQKTAMIQQTRQTGLVEGPKAFQLPTGVTGISKGGALIVTPGTSTNLVVNMTIGKSKRR